MDKNNEQLRKIQLQLKQDGIEQGEKEVKPIYREQKKAMNELIEFITTLYVVHAVDGLLKANKTQKNEITNKSETLLISLGNKLSKGEVNTISDILDKTYKDDFFKHAYIYELGGMHINFKIERQEFIDAIVNKKFHGDDFSNKIWSNKADLIDSLHKEILSNLQGKTPIDKAIKNIQDRFAVNSFKSKRIFVTELARVQIEAHDDISRQAGIKRQLYDVTLDSKTSKWCIPYSDTIWDIDDPRKPKPPLHPFCRSVLIDLTDSWKFTQKKDNQSKELIDYVEYNQWLKNKGISY